MNLKKQQIVKMILLTGFQIFTMFMLKIKTVMQKWRKLIAETVSRNKVKENVGEFRFIHCELRGVFSHASFLLHFAASLYL